MIKKLIGIALVVFSFPVFAGFSVVESDSNVSDKSVSVQGVYAISNSQTVIIRAAEYTPDIGSPHNLLGN